MPRLATSAPTFTPRFWRIRKAPITTTRIRATFCRSEVEGTAPDAPRAHARIEEAAARAATTVRETPSTTMIVLSTTVESGSPSTTNCFAA